MKENKGNLKPINKDRCEIDTQYVALMEWKIAEYETRNNFLANQIFSLVMEAQDTKLERLESQINILTDLVMNKKMASTFKKNGCVDKRLRQKIILRDGMICKNCNKHLIKGDVHIDHIIPLSKGGLSIESNLRVLCKACNLLKKNYLFNEKAKINPPL